MKKEDKILVAGGTGLVGSAITEKLSMDGYQNIIATYHSRTPQNMANVRYIQIDFTDQKAVAVLFQREKPDFVFCSAAKVGGIGANNTYRGQFIYENLQIQNNVIHQSHIHKVKKLLFLGSSCIYPKNSPQPIKEEYLLTNVLEYTNEPYAIAKIAGLKTCEGYNLQYGDNFITAMPTNLYGLNDNFHLENSHVLPALIRKLHLAKCLQNNDIKAIRKDFAKNPVKNIAGDASQEKLIQILKKYGITYNLKSKKAEVILWGSGKPRREFLFATDLADACIFVMKEIDFQDILKNDFKITDFNTPYCAKEIRNTHINIGTGKDLSIKELAELIKEITEFTGKIFWNTSQPDGTYRKLLDVSKLNTYGWSYKTELSDGIKYMYSNYIK